MDPVLVTLRTSGGYFVCAEGGGGDAVVADRVAAGPWEEFRVHTFEDGRVGLQSADGHFLTAELDGTVRARAVEPGPWERWTYEVRAGAGVAFLSDHGRYLVADGGGGGVVLADRVPGPTVPGEWEFFVPSASWWDPVIPPNPNRLIGPLDRSGRVILDQSGPRILMACHFMEGFSAFCHGKSVGGLDVRTQLEIIAESYGAVRNLDVLGYYDQNRPGDADEWVAWAGREVTPIPFIANSGREIPATPDYWGKKREYVTLLHELGLQIFDDRGDLNGWDEDEKVDHMFRNGEFYASLPFGREVLAGLWGCNEAWQNGADSVDLLQRMIEAFQFGAGWLPALVGLSSPGGSSDPEALAECDPPMTSWEPEMPASFAHWSQDPATVVTCHGNRGDHSHIVEHYFGYGYDETIRKLGKPVVNTEPVGGGTGVSVGQVNDPELLCALTAAALLGGQAWTFMSGSGVFWDSPIEDMPGFLEVARLPTFLPDDIASWSVVCHAGTRFAGVRILGAVDPTRCEHAIADDGRFVLVVHTLEQSGNALPVERACAEFTVIDMVSGLVERSGPIGVGEFYRHPGVARLIIGQLAGSSVTLSTAQVNTMMRGKRRAGRLARIAGRVRGEGWTA